MSIQPEGEDLRKAVKWISDERKFGPKRPLQELIEKAAMEYDLSPKDEDYLFKFFTKK